ncbi:globin domain-containing protein [Spirosoma radiotolerans]|uniref:globin domain-containing protein n=1 Tax=Spirosoma radiotolerans TaxID=1379870 RepID=UPI000698D683|nr:globin domain-containing protein [Spirosoma radiotolerans]
MTTDQKQLIKATIPVLKESGLLLTTHFYQRVFAHNPELKNTFNMGNQQNGHQPTALAMTVLAYAENIDDPSVLLSALNRIASRHTSLDIRPEHYDLIGRHLIASIGEVLGAAASPALLDAWTAAYGQLASLMIRIEAKLYATQVTKPGGWTGWRPFLVNAKQNESSGVTSFRLYPADGGPVADPGPGQYLSIRLFMPTLNLLQSRQFTISNAPNGQYYCITVKQAAGKDSSLNGQINRQLLDVIQEGDRLDVSLSGGACPMAAPAGVPTRPAYPSGCPMHQMA